VSARASPAVGERVSRELRKRRPHVAIACVATGLALAPAGAARVAIAAVLAAAVAVNPFGRRAAIAALLLVLGAGTVGGLRLAAIDRPARAAPPGTAIDAVATLVDRPRSGLFGSSATMRLESGPARGLRILARQRDFAWPAVDPGVRFHLRGVVRTDGPAPAPTTSSGIRVSEANAGRPGTPGFGPLPAKHDPGAEFDYAAFLRSRGVGRQVQVESLWPMGRRGGVSGLLDSMRRRAETGIDVRLPPEQAALARGMVLGEDGDVAMNVRDDFQRSGLAHVLAASGQNVALLCALALPLLMLVGASQRIRVAVLLPLVAVYVALAGSGASVMRAGVMGAAGLIAIATGRRSSAVYSLLLAAVITLALNPRATADPGWQLSFVAVAGMLLLGPLVRHPLRRLPRPLAEAVGATTAATLATAPLMAHQFGAVSVVALPANIAAFPAVAPVMWIGMTEAAAEQLGALHVLSVIPHALETMLAPVSSLALRWVAGVATRFADPPWAQSQLQLAWTPVAAIYLVLAVAVLAIPRLVEGRLRSRLAQAGSTSRLAGMLDTLRAMPRPRRRLLAMAPVALLLAAASDAAAPPPPPHHVVVDFIDVGQGDSTLIRDPGGTAVLFDGGVPEARVDRTLRHLGVRRLSVVVATHQSRDHHGGLLQVVRRFPIGLFLDGRYGVNDPTFFQLEREVDSRHIPRRPIVRGERLRIGAMTIRVLWPPPRGNAAPPANPNERAAVTIVSEAGFDLFLSADAESEVDLPLPLPRVDAMKVPHHGSADPGLPALLKRLQPRVAAIETGRGNSYGHPRPSTLNALRGHVPLVYRTDRDGTVELTVIGDRLAIRTHR